MATTDFVNVKKQAIADSRSALDFQRQWDNDDRRSWNEVTVDATLKLVQPIVEQLEYKIRQLEEKIATQLDADASERIKTKVMEKIAELEQLSPDQ